MHQAKTRRRHHEPSTAGRRELWLEARLPARLICCGNGKKPQNSPTRFREAPINLKDDLESRENTDAAWMPNLGQLNLDVAFPDHYEYLNSPDEDFLGNYPDSGAITIGHELGHAYMGEIDPFNVYVVENPLRKSFGVPKRPRYDPDAYDNPINRGDNTGLIWPGNTMEFSKSIPIERWEEGYIKAVADRDAFVKQWTCCPKK